MMTPDIRLLAGVFVAIALAGAGAMAATDGGGPAAPLPGSPPPGPDPSEDEAVVAVVGTPNTFGDFDAWRITNNTGLGVSGVTLTFTPASYGNFDDNLPDQAAYGFNLHSSSDPTGVSRQYADPSSAPADCHGWRTLALSFTDFDPGEQLVFGHDTDGSIGTVPPNWGAHSGDAFSGNLGLIVNYVNGYSEASFFELTGPTASTAVVGVPEPATLALLGLGALGLIHRRRRGAAADGIHTLKREGSEDRSGSHAHVVARCGECPPSPRLRRAG